MYANCRWEIVISTSQRAHKYTHTRAVTELNCTIKHLYVFKCHYTYYRKRWSISSKYLRMFNAINCTKRTFFSRLVLNVCIFLPWIMCAMDERHFGSLSDFSSGLIISTYQIRWWTKFPSSPYVCGSSTLNMLFTCPSEIFLIKSERHGNSIFHFDAGVSTYYTVYSHPDNSITTYIICIDIFRRLLMPWLINTLRDFIFSTQKRERARSLTPKHTSLCDGWYFFVCVAWHLWRLIYRQL